MLEPLAVDPKRSLAPAANNIASARLVFPAPAGPTSAITRVPLDGCPAMRLSLRAVTGARVALERGASAPALKPPPSACFSSLARGFGARHGSLSRNRVEALEVWRGDGRSQGTSGEFAVADA